MAEPDNNIDLAAGSRESPFGAPGSSWLAETRSSEPIEVMLARIRKESIAFYGALAMVAVIFATALGLSVAWGLSAKGAYPNLDGEMIEFLLSTLKIISAGAVGYALKGH
jgi:hypothetical protein